jgi:hypothetical protein
MEMSAPELSASMKPYNGVSGRQETLIVVRNYLRSRLRNGTEVVDHVSLGHADATVADGEDFIILVWGDADEEIIF